MSNTGKTGSRTLVTATTVRASTIGTVIMNIVVAIAGMIATTAMTGTGVTRKQEGSTVAVDGRSRAKIVVTVAVNIKAEGINKDE